MIKKLHSFIIFLYFAIGVFLLFYFLFYGWDYYNLPINERVFNSKHPELKPSGYIGHGLGIVGSLMMIIGVSSYMIRKRWRRIHRLGYLKHWLEFHIFMCSVGPLLIVFHSAFKFGEIISIGFWSMVIVVLSGVIGRVIYIQLPKTLQGENLTKDEIEKIINELLLKLDPLYHKELITLLELDITKKSSAEVGNKLKLGDSFFDSIKVIFSEGLKGRTKYKALKSVIYSKPDISYDMRKESLRITKQIVSLRNKELLYNAFENLFRHWHIFHLPFAITMFVLMFIHIIVAILFGAKWIF